MRLRVAANQTESDALSVLTTCWSCVRSAHFHAYNTHTTHIPHVEPASQYYSAPCVLEALFIYYKIVPAVNPMPTPSGCTLNTGTLHCARPSAPSCDPEMPAFERVKCGTQAPRLAMGPHSSCLMNKKKDHSIARWSPWLRIDSASIPHGLKVLSYSANNRGKRVFVTLSPSFMPYVASSHVSPVHHAHITRFLSACTQVSWLVPEAR